MPQKIRPLAFLMLLFFAGCSAPSGSGLLGLPAAQASGLGAPVQDFAIPGRLLTVQAGNLVQWSGGNLRPFAGGYHYDAPAFSPDGMRVAVSIVGTNHSDLVLLDTSGKRLGQLTDNWSKSRVEDSAWARHPSWSPDGRRLAYASDAFGSQMSLWLVDVAGTNRYQFYPSPVWGGLDEPSWSPDGRVIAVTVFEPTASQIFIVNSSSASASKLIENEEGVYDPTWSADGEYLAYVARTKGRSDIWIADRPGTKKTRVTDLGAARSPAWSPAGNLLAFFADQGNGFDLYILRLPDQIGASNGELKRLTDGQNFDAAAGIAWGP